MEYRARILKSELLSTFEPFEITADSLEKLFDKINELDIVKKAELEEGKGGDDYTFALFKGDEFIRGFGLNYFVENGIMVNNEYVTLLSDKNRKIDYTAKFSEFDDGFVKHDFYEITADTLQLLFIDINKLPFVQEAKKNKGDSDLNYLVKIREIKREIGSFWLNDYIKNGFTINNEYFKPLIRKQNKKPAPDSSKQKNSKSLSINDFEEILDTHIFSGESDGKPIFYSDYGWVNYTDRDDSELNDIVQKDENKKSSKKDKKKNREAKYFDAKLNGIIDARFTLQFIRDENGEEAGILTVPYIHICTLESFEVLDRIYEIKGAVLECIEKQFFDNKLSSIPVIGHYENINMDELILKLIPKEIYKQMLAGTFQIPDDADKTIYGNLPVKIKSKPVKRKKT